MINFRYGVIDLETSGTRTFGRFCNPLDTRNVITSIAVYDSKDDYTKVMYDKKEINRQVPIYLDDYKLLVGQNIKFDLLYLWTNPYLQKWIKDGGQIWDTMLAEYLISGQQTGQNDLDTLAIKYGGRLKDKAISDMYKAGLMSNQIDKDQLLEYNRQDVLNTNIIFKNQYVYCKKHKLLPLMKTYMEHLLAITEMEYNGLYVDVEIADQKQKEFEARKIQLLMGFVVYAGRYLDSIKAPDWALQAIDIDSPKQVSALFFGGDIEIKKKVDSGEVYKSGLKKGEIKLETKVYNHTLPPMFHTLKDYATSREGVYSVKDDVLVDLKRRYPEANANKLELIDVLQRYRAVSKLLSTYYYNEEIDKSGNVTKITGVLSKVHPKTSTIHSEFNSATTVTGRLSSSSPNGQNLPVEIMDMFTSRYGKDGSIVEIDMSQLEVVVQAFLAQSDMMITDIKAGMDFHRLRLSYALNKTYAEVKEVDDYAYKRKTIAKPISFQKAYGAHYKTVSHRTGLSEDLVKRVFIKEDERYPEIPLFYASIVDTLNKNKKYTGKLAEVIDKKTKQILKMESEREFAGVYKTPTGKRYRFVEKVINSDKGIFRYWHMPDVQNYPVQGTAADIVSLLVGTVYRQLVLDHPDKFKIVQEIHDSLILDVKDEHIDLIVDKVGTIMNSGAKLIEQRFGFKFNAPLKADIKVGKSWKQCKED